MYEHHDVLIVGAGISGISAAVHIQKALPGTDYLILEKREAIGGTWDLFRYPGVRSDSDMYTLGFDFKPWEHTRAIGDGATIRSYLQEAAREQGVDQHIRYGYGVESAEWDSNAARWTVTARVADGEQVKLTANFLYFGAGYYSYENPYRPEFPGEQNFKGELFHAQLWPEDLDYKDKRVVVIGSGATAVTLVPALAKQAAHVTMLQRSPSYVLSLPGEDALANQLRKVLPKHVSYQITRGAHLLLTYGSWQFFRHQPERAAALLRKLQERQLPEDYPVDVHFKPRYKVWDERL
ncbi:MAG: NAD(P)/FAD-dependent oxidoreductase, partial [Solirubrobacterales bacterium]|nr:NAD(P)/FAD-dependent oxidoreductase [Solirubrobacterales bacterium]